MSGKRLAEYRLLEELGSGATSTVHLAEVTEHVGELEPGQRVAIKILHPHVQARAESTARFLREIQIGRSIRHPNVVHVLDADAALLDGRMCTFLVMEYVEGRTLRQLLEEVGPLQEGLCRHVGEMVARGLAAIHRAHIVHRDVKPENLLITNDYHVKVMDLGIARIRDEANLLSRDGEFKGSILYAAPEQIRDGGPHVDGRSDLYALGLTLYELAVGRHPFHGDDVGRVLTRHLEEMPERPSACDVSISPFFDEVVATLLAKDPDARFAGAAELEAVLAEGERSSWWLKRQGELRQAATRSLRRARVPRETRLHGRREETRILRDLWQAARSGRGQVVLVEGEAGIGKSRLVDDFAASLETGGQVFHYLYGAFPPGGVALAGGAWSTAFREHFGALGLEDALAAHLPAGGRMVGSFAALLRGEPPPPESGPLPTDAVQTAFVRVTRGLAAERPLLLLVDDLHAAPRESREIFAALVHAIRGDRVMLVATTRPGLPADWVVELRRLDHVTPIPLERLDETDIEELVAEAIGNPTAAARLLPHVARRTEGNPFFVFEVLRSLRDADVLARATDGRWTVHGDPEAVRIPPGIEDLIEARLEGLDVQDRALLEVAACVGYEFDPLLLAGITQRPRIQVLTDLSRLERAHRLVHAKGHHCVFDHQLVQEVLHARMPAAQRRVHHTAIGRTLDARLSAEVEPLGPVVVATCRHLLAGGDAYGALKHLDAALTHLAEGHLHDEAAELAAQALAEPDLLGARRRARLLLQQAGWLGMAGRRQEEGAALAEALALAEAVGDLVLETRATLHHAVHLRDTGRSGDAVPHFEKAVENARTIGDRKLEGEALGSLGTALEDLGRIEEAIRHHRDQLAIARADRDTEGEAKATGNLAVAYAVIGRTEDSLEAFRTCAELFDRLPSIRWRASAYCNLGLGLTYAHKNAEAIGHLEHSLELAREAGYRGGEAHALGNLGVACLQLGRLDDAHRYFRADLSMQEELGNPKHHVIAMLNCGDLEVLLGDTAQGRAHLEQSLSTAHAIGYRAGVVPALRSLATLDLEEGRASQALSQLEECLVLCREMGMRTDECQALLDVGRLHYLGSDRSAARPFFVEGVALARELGSKNMELEAAAHLAVLDADRIADVRSVLDACEKEAGLYTTMEVRFRLWEADAKPADLAEAHRILTMLRHRAPAGAHTAIVERRRLHRDIEEAWLHHGAGRDRPIPPPESEDRSPASPGSRRSP